MIRMIQSNSSAHAKSYFSEALSKADYYINDQELKGTIRGKLAERLGVSGEATKEAFHALCDNRQPGTKKQLTPSDREGRRVGYDINFHCPKSVSIVHALSKDDHILRAFEASVHETMSDIEKDMKTRVRKNGMETDRDTGELIYADFVHQTARPTQDCAPDMHLHAHCFVFNATWDDVEKCYKAGQFGDIKRDMPYYQARFHKRLSDKLIDLGYQVKVTDKSFELEGVPKKVIDLFSKRTDEIGRVAQEKGITDKKELDGLGARTRSKKESGLSMEELRQDWKRQISELEIEEGETGKAIRYNRDLSIEQETATMCLDKAVNHCFERASVMQERRLLERAYRFAIGNKNASINGVTDAFHKNESLMRVKEKKRTMVTTREVLYEEKEMVEIARHGNGQFEALYEQAPELSLTGQQAEAVTHVLTTKNMVSIVRGAAGSGKTTLMNEAISLIEKKGKKVTILAPTAQASRGVLRDEGFRDATTVAQFLNDRSLQQEVNDQVIWVDEAGLLGTKDTRDLMRIAQSRNARIIFGGDTRQHSSVTRGDALRILNTVGGIKSAEVSRIYRQKDIDYRHAVQLLADGAIKQGFERLDRIGSIKEVDPLKPNDTLVEDYMKAIKDKKSALVISPTHKQGDQVTEAIRRRLKAEKRLGRKELTLPRYVNLNYTEAEKSDIKTYQEGQTIILNQNIKGIEKGSVWKVVKDDFENLVMEDKNGRMREIPHKEASKIDVFEAKEIKVAKGDKLIVTKNTMDLDKRRIDNGYELEVVQVKKSGEIRVKNPKSHSVFRLNDEFGYLNHHYCTTSHSSQGKTVDRVFISQPAETFSATNAKQFYVSVSRGREQVTIYTDSKQQLLEHASEIGNRESALEMLTKSELHKEYVLGEIRKNEVNREQELEETKKIVTPQRNRDYE